MFQEKIKSFFYLKIFLLFFMVLVIGSICFKVGEEIVDSSFKNNSFSLLIVSKDSKYISLNKKDKSVVFLALGDIRQFVKGKKPVEATFALGIPIDSMLIDSMPPVNLAEFATAKNQWRLLVGNKIVYKNLNRYDIIKIAGAINSSIKDNRTEVRINLFNQEELKEKLDNKLADSTITNTPLTIEINNGTSINGLGSLFAIILARRGYNVISVKTANSSDNSFIAYPDGEDEFIKQLKTLTRFPVLKTKKSQSADVTVFLGDDLDAMLSP